MIQTKATKALQTRLEDLCFRTQEESAEKLSMAKIAAEIGIEKSSLSKYCNDQAECGINNLCKIADYFGVSCDYLLGRSNAYSTELDMQAACNTVGLEQPVIERIQSFSDLENYVLSCIIMDPEVKRAFYDIMELYIKTQTYRILQESAEKYNNDFISGTVTEKDFNLAGIAVSLTLPDQINFCEYKAVNKLKSAIERIAEEADLPIDNSAVQKEIRAAMEKAKEICERELN